MSLGATGPLPGPTAAAGPAEGSEPPAPQRPSWRFTWGWRAVLAVFVVVFAVLAGIGQVPVDQFIQWRVLLLTLAAALGGIAVATLWVWAGRRRLTRADAAQIARALSEQQKQAIRHALRRRGRPLTAALHPWARAYAAAQQSTVPIGLTWTLLGAGNLAVQATDPSFPHWVGLSFVAFMLTVFPLLAAGARWQQHRAEHLEDLEDLPDPTGPAERR